ncbi:unnamed protein product [Ostreobium quekettii]|uniref:Uncharacterized protein n=1 Tax=Ostreobium quekettii TaxID=121088 RepID=A0A8S1IV67_9CHLO|nr:unnamed protein product [Ostreobium quekettii]
MIVDPGCWLELRKIHRSFHGLSLSGFETMAMVLVHQSTLQDFETSWASAHSALVPGVVWMPGKDSSMLERWVHQYLILKIACKIAMGVSICNGRRRCVP